MKKQTKKKSVHVNSNHHPFSMSHATSELLSDLFMPPATQLYPLTAVSVNKHHGRSGSRAQQVQACSAVVEKQASG